jgi:hypothetical protein
MKTSPSPLPLCGRLPVRLLRLVVLLAVLLAAILIGGYLILCFCIASPWAVRQASRVMTGLLGQPVTVAGLRLEGGTLTVTDARIANLPAFAGEPLVTARTVTVTPEWTGLLDGRTSFSRIDIEGVRVSIRRNSAGTWNFAALAARLAARKSNRETTIAHLTLKDASLLVNGRGFERINLNVSDLATKGSSNSKLLISFRDANGGNYQIEGDGGLGANPYLNISLTGSAISLRSLAAARPPLDMANGTANLRFTVRLHSKQLAVAGESHFDRLALRLKSGLIPIRGSLSFKGGYDLVRDSAAVEQCVLILDDLGRIEATAQVRGVKGGRSFSAELSSSGIELKRLARLLPRKTLQGLEVAGTLHPGPFRLAGDGRHGITSAEGRLGISKGELIRGGRLLIRGLSAEMLLSGGKPGWSLRGRLWQPEGATGGMAEGLVAPFSLALSSRFRLLEAELPEISVRIAALPVRGMLAYRPSAAAPFAGTIELPEVAASDLNQYLASRQTRLSSGKGSLIVRATGRGPADFHADLTARTKGVKGMAGKREFALQEATTKAVISQADGALGVTGNIQASGARMGKMSGDGAFDYRLSGGVLAISNVLLRTAGATLQCADIHGPLPERQAVSDGRLIPLRLAFNGMGLEKGGTRLAGLTGNFIGRYRREKEKQWLEGTGEAALNELTLTGANGKVLLANGSARLRAELTDGALKLNEAVLSAGREVAFRLHGTVDRVATSGREGEVFLSLPATPASALIPAFSGLLPRSLQEAALTGNVAVDGAFRIAGRALRFNGELAMIDAGMDIHSQKLSIAGISGRVPLSIITGERGNAPPAGEMEFSRENYPALLLKLQRQKTPDNEVKIGRIGFGPLELGETTLTMRAGNGLMEITSIASTLHKGRVLGAGFLRTGNGATYGGNLLLNDISLKNICNSLPAIKGYISGTVDGIVSLRGDRTGLKGLLGFVDIWARSGPKETMLVSKEFLQRLAGRKLKGIFFRNDRPYDRGEISASLGQGYINFDLLDISHTNLFGIRDLSVQVALVQNRIAIEHLFTSIKAAAARGKGVVAPEANQALPETEFKWQE